MKREFPLAESRSSWDKMVESQRTVFTVHHFDRLYHSSESQQNVARARHARNVPTDRELDVPSIAWVFRAGSRTTRGRYSVQVKPDQTLVRLRPRLPRN